MVKYRNMVLWVLLLVCLVMAGGGINLRVGNEERNKAVITAVDYKEFLKMSNSAGMDLNQIMDRLQAMGVKTVGVKEVTLRDLAYQGDIYLTPYGEFMAFNRIYSPGIWQTALNAAAGARINPDKLVAGTTNPETAAFLKQRLGNRFAPDQIIHFSSDGQEFFVVNAELTQLEKPREPKKEPEQFKDIDARLGFDENVISQLQARGFEIILRPDNNTGPNLAFIQEYEQLVSRHHIKYVLFDNEVTGNPDHLQPMEQIVRRHHLIVGIIETSAQLQYVKQPGLDQLMQATSYPINRVYSSTNDEYLQNASERYYRWVRGVVDRGIRIVYVSPFKDTRLSYSENINNTLEMLARFQQTIQEKRFYTDQPLNHLSSDIPGRFHYLMVALSLLMGTLLYLAYLCRLRTRSLVILLAIGVLGSLALTLGLNHDFTQIYALAAAVLYPSLSSLLLLLYLRDYQHHSWPRQILAGLGILLAVNLAGMFTVVTSLADIRYIMNVFVFRGVKLAFLLPLMLFVLNYFVCFAGDSGFLNRVAELLKKQPSYLVLFLFAVLALAAYYYIGRSGNSGTVGVSSLEIRLRETLETWFLARPRFKEIIIGYPALFAMIYLYKRYRQEFILLLLGLAVVIGSISMVNSFCHVFTAVAISASRTWGGLLVGTLCGLAALAGIRVLEIIWARFSAVYKHWA